MSKWLIRGGVLVLLVAGWQTLRMTVFAPKPVEVRVVRVERGRVEAALTNTRAGSVRARRRAALSPETSGRVVEILYREGDRVEAGEVIVRLDDTSQRAQLALARKSFETAELRHQENCILARRATREHERYQKAGNDLVSPDRLDELASRVETAEAACATSLAQVEQSRASIAVHEAELAKTELRAPFGGTLAEVAIEVGEFVTPSPPGILLPAALDLIDLGSIYVSAPMDEVDSAAIRAQQRARVTIDPFPDRSFDGRVVRVAPYVLDVESQNRTVEIEVELDDAEFAQRLLPGTSADVEVILEVEEDALRVPNSVLIEGKRVLAFEDDTIHERKVEVGLRNWDWVQILSGVTEGERIVSSLGDPDVVDGAEARIVEPAEDE